MHLVPSGCTSGPGRARETRQDDSRSVSLEAPGEGAWTAGVAAEPRHIGTLQAAFLGRNASLRLLDDLIVAYKAASRLQDNLQTTSWSVQLQ